MTNTLNETLIRYVYDQENANNNFNLAVEYDRLNQGAAAVSYYLRAAERTQDDLLSYYCLIRIAQLFTIQTNRSRTVHALYKLAIAFKPERPEAYYCYSKLLESEGDNITSYLMCELGLRGEVVSRNDFIGYPGSYALLFQKSVAAWYVGKPKESRELLQKIISNYQVSEHDYSIICEMIKTVGGNVPTSNHFFNFPKDFDWSLLSYADITTIEREVVHEKVYRVWNDVKEGDVVLDIGASVGAYTISILDQKPKKVYCVEPSKKLLKTLAKNCSEKVFNYSENPLTYINSGIIKDKINDVNIFTDDETFTGITFKDMIEKYSIDHVDFMKVDCEGGEYSIFIEENMNFLLNNVKFIAMEVHLRYQGGRDMFKTFRDNYLTQFKNYKVMSCTCQTISQGNSIDIKDMIFDDNFIDTYCCEFMIYISNE